MKKYTLISILLILTFSSLCYAEGLNSLIEVGKSQAEIQKAYAEETAIYNVVKKDVQKGVLVKGISNSDVISRYGQPVVMFKEFGTGRDTWIYKPAGATFFEGEKIYLLFTKEGILDEVKEIK